MSLPLDSFEIIRTADGFTLGKSSEKQCFFKTIEFEDYIFSVCNETDFILMQKGFTDIIKQ